MRDTSGNGWRQLFFQQLACACILAGLAFCPAAALAGPRPPLPPVPERPALYYQGFDQSYSPTSFQAHISVAGLGTLVESWSGYALDRSGPNVIPWILPGVDASGHANVSCVSGAIRV